MNEHDATEQAYCNGYEAGCAAANAQIVRCKDCKHMSRLINMVHCDAWERFNGMGEDGFCNYGERKEEK